MTCFNHFATIHVFSTSAQPMAPPAQMPAAYGGGSRRPGSINDYDPITGNSQVNSPYSAKTQSTTVFNSQGQGTSRSYQSPFFGRRSPFLMDRRDFIQSGTFLGME